MKTLKILRILISLVIGAALLSAGLIAAILVFEIPIDAEMLREPLARMASQALGRKVAFTGNFKFVTSLNPAIEIGEIRISNPPGFPDTDFARLKRARLKLNALKLIGAKIHISELEVHGFALNLETRADGAVNWRLSPANTAQRPAAPSPAPPGQTGKKRTDIALGLSPDSFSIQRMTFTDISVKRIANGRTDSYDIRKCVGTGKEGQPFVFDFEGDLLEHPYTARIKAGSLAEFLTSQTAWLDIAGRIANTDLTFSGEVRLPLAAGGAKVKAGARGDNLADLDSLLGVDLPPFKRYAADCALTLGNNTARLDGLSIRVGDSGLNGTAMVRRGEPRPLVQASFTSDRIQLRDFSLGNWSATHERDSDPRNSTSANASKHAPAISADISLGNGTSAQAALLSPETLRRLDARLRIEATSVLAGTEDLGGGLLVLGLSDGRLSIAPLELHIPGGSIRLDAGLEPLDHGVQADIGLKVDNFDYGPIVQRAKPGSRMGGLISLDIGLNSTSPSYADIMAHANGHFRVAARPEHLEAGVLDLWAVNLFTAAMTSMDKDKSRINCAILRLNIANGVMTSETIMADTSRIRIFGQASADFRNQRVEVKAAPTAKRPEFFSLSTPIAINGSFNDFSVSVNPLSLIGTIISFITSPIQVPIRRIFETPPPADGSDICVMDFSKQASVPGLVANATRTAKPKADPFQHMIPRL